MPKNNGKEDAIFAESSASGQASLKTSSFAACFCWFFSLSFLPGKLSVPFTLPNLLGQPLAEGRVSKMKKRSKDLPK